MDLESSPPGSFSIFITFAPRSLKIAVALGPDILVVKSSTLYPFNIFSAYSLSKFEGMNYKFLSTIN
ncbi:hypothetical protein, partial [Acidiplasma aeolicum]|uniref:hypothetical protein n=1 Tax=Acidiplasma aeolicum TaxID=507754 RepID=UPI001F3DF64E